LFLESAGLGVNPADARQMLLATDPDEFFSNNHQDVESRKRRIMHAIQAVLRASG